jgi:hypothetical protein
MWLVIYILQIITSFYREIKVLLVEILLSFQFILFVTFCDMYSLLWSVYMM